MQPYDEIQIANMHPDAPEDSYISTLRGMLEDDDETPELIDNAGDNVIQAQGSQSVPSQV
jgi:hypothetical protein